MKPLSQGCETSHSERIYNVDVQRRGFSLIDQKLSKYGGLNLDEFEKFWGIDEFEKFWDIYATLCSRHFGMKPLFQGCETSHSERIYIVDVQRRGFSLIDQKLSK